MFIVLYCFQTFQLNNSFFRPQILDLVAASSTPNALQAALTYFGKVKDYDENLERFLISLSVLPRPEGFILKGIKVKTIFFFLS